MSRYCFRNTAAASSIDGSKLSRSAKSAVPASNELERPPREYSAVSALFDIVSGLSEPYAPVDPRVSSDGWEVPLSEQLPINLIITKQSPSVRQR
ncbi:hypothetical protein BDA99DRAFT_556217 [Phascolomyces articulosus]|uniref:Uncharacterized protein n=1 Tax=Phascolomyces articulosus TaxID=60185 RepID=A0AAD5PIU7_9FUNG|nr:hypothetical protein BDA99DRAFT_556217 [Phascolomyces articulosus]